VGLATTLAAGKTISATRGIGMATLTVLPPP